MRVGSKNQRTLWPHPDRRDTVCVIDQRHLPHAFVTAELRTVEDVYLAIRDMWVRGAPLIGVTAAYGMYFAALEASGSGHFDQTLENAAQRLISSRPTAVNLAWAVETQLAAMRNVKSAAEKIRASFENANRLAEEDVENCRKIGAFGLTLIAELAKKNPGRPVQILTHCNAGWLACIDWGTATSPIYQAFEAGIPVHVWVDETRPRNQGASLTAWELGQHGVPYTLITDNAGGHLMQTGKVDLVIVGTDRTTRSGDVANKIGTYLKALAANDNAIPFYAAVPSSSIDWAITSGVREIPIEERNADEVRYMTGLNAAGKAERVLIAPQYARISNYGFDVTPARLVTGLITERGIGAANEDGLLKLFPEYKTHLPIPGARDEGVIKFECRWQEAPPLALADLSELIPVRNELFTRGLIGVYPDGVGYGNLSIRRTPAPGFIISGTQTGHLAKIGAEHFTLVSDCDIPANRLECRGPLKASSESLTHAMLYETFPEVCAVIHVHSPALWKKLLNRVPTTSAAVPYGTPQMAWEIKRLAAESSLAKKGILVMAGHEDGVITMGKDLADARQVLRSYL
ncbi:MAG: hypothetical protein A2Y02_02480 [Omnitrophica bacterium GWA2_52_12]|nr:MAG: hypothetical protein A2Y02_02480 [Omnitrophica bacterium GWA2_52_12]